MIFHILDIKNGIYPKDSVCHITFACSRYIIDVACHKIPSVGDWYVGKALCLALGKKGIFVTVVDFSEKGAEVASLVKKENAEFHSNLEFPAAMFIKCDVTNTSKEIISVSDIFCLSASLTEFYI